MLFGFTRKTNRPAERLGISLTTSAVASCVVDTTGLRLVDAGVHSIDSNILLIDMLTRLARAHGWRGLPCHITLATDDYKIVPAETPAVAETEINPALLWSLREVLDTKPEDTAIDSFPFAGGLSLSGKPARHAVATSKQRIRSIVEAALEAGLALESIDIPELSLRNLVARLPENEHGAGLISQNGRGVAVTLYRGGELYVTRQLAGVSNLDEAGHPLTMPRLAEQLGLELLRTLDYYDSQLRQRPPATIYIQPIPGEARPLLENLGTTINLPVKLLRFEDVVTGAEQASAEVQSRCLSALGAALREDAA